MHGIDDRIIKLWLCEKKGNGTSLLPSHKVICATWKKNLKETLHTLVISLQQLHCSPCLMLDSLLMHHMILLAFVHLMCHEDIFITNEKMMWFP
jgi:hypothetical protein